MTNMAIPTILVSGFLGSGKTTFINQILHDHPEKKISLILNEFGDIKLESKFIEVTGMGMVSELSGGCLCCVANVDLPRVIRYTLETAPKTEHLIIEASGLSDPDPVRATLTSPSLTELITLNTNITIVDADNYDTSSRDHPLVLSQIAEADYALLSKIEGHTNDEITKLVQKISTIGLGTKTIIWDGSFDTNIIFDPPLTPYVHEDKVAHHSHRQYEQYYYLSNESHNIDLLFRVISQLPTNILRVKGISGNYLIQKVGNNVDVKESQKIDEKYDTAILIIGTNLDKTNFQSLLAKCRVGA